jgi:hypothetical protein
MLRKPVVGLYLCLVLFLALGLVASCGGGGGGSSNNTNSPTYTLSGTISGAVQPGVTITLSGAGSGTTSTDASGHYSFSGLGNGAYTVTASKANYAFTPASQPVLINNASGTNINFAGANAYSISGNVVNGSALPIAGVTMTLTGGNLASAMTAMTDASGNYVFNGLVTNGTYTLTPSKSESYTYCTTLTGYASYTFSPTSVVVSVSGADTPGENFTGTAPSYGPPRGYACPN